MSNRTKHAALEEVRAQVLGLFLALAVVLLAPSGCDPKHATEIEQSQ
ncbi:MAG: hypothetical protein N4A61_04800 [Pelagimonas sp.]|jgi:hypothetical protein|nr:hypothetical protein [Pelagimonas sp.]